NIRKASLRVCLLASQTRSNLILSNFPILTFPLPRRERIKVRVKYEIAILRGIYPESVEGLLAMTTFVAKY
ncbi:hypothetical protein KAX75_07795, partial [candidate division WOR-3 bacterium]|nr:hypothetical protein [candidate division WOR-3 bacterium]